MTRQSSKSSTKNLDFIDRKKRIPVQFRMGKDSRQSDELLTASEAAKMLDITKQRVSQLIKSGKLKAKSIDGKYLIRLEDVKAIEDRKTGRPRKDEVTKPEADTHTEVWKVTIEAIVRIERKPDDEIKKKHSDDDDDE